MQCTCEAPLNLLVKGLDIAGAKSGRKQAQASADDVTKAYEVLLGHGFKDMQIQQAMQVLLLLQFRQRHCRRDML